MAAVSLSKLWWKGLFLRNICTLAFPFGIWITARDICRAGASVPGHGRGNLTVTYSDSSWKVKGFIMS